MADTGTSIVFAADLERTRGRAEHARVQDRMTRLADLLADRYHDLLEVPAGVVDGDRLQISVAISDEPEVASRRAARLVELICEADLRLGGVPLVHGIGLGTLDRTGGALRGNAAELTGPAVDRTLAGIEEARRERLFLGAGGFPDDGAVRGAFSGLGVLMRGWTRRQSQFVRALLQDGVLEFDGESRRFLPERKRKEVAERFSVSPSVVTESLQAAQVRAFRDCMWGAAAALEHQAFGMSLTAR